MLSLRQETIVAEALKKARVSIPSKGTVTEKFKELENRVESARDDIDQALDILRGDGLDV